MIQKKGNACVFYAFFVSSKTGKTGLSPTIDVYENGTQIVTGGATVEVGGGLYKYTLVAGSVDANGEYVAIFKTSDATVDQQWIPAMWVTPTWVDNIDVAVSSRALSGSLLQAAHPVDPITGDVRIYAGDDYDVDDANRGISWPSEEWPDLTGATLLTLTVRHVETDVVMFSLLSTDAELDTQDAGTATQRVRVLMLPDTKSILLTDYGRKYKADVEAVLANTNKVTLVDVFVIAAKKQTRP